MRESVRQSNCLTVQFFFFISVLNLRLLPFLKSPKIIPKFLFNFHFDLSKIQIPNMLVQIPSQNPYFKFIHLIIYLLLLFFAYSA